MGIFMSEEILKQLVRMLSPKGSEQRELIAPIEASNETHTVVNHKIPYLLYL